VGIGAVAENGVFLVIGSSISLPKKVVCLLAKQNFESLSYVGNLDGFLM
jgi:hypothetical protein